MARVESESLVDMNAPFIFCAMQVFKEYLLSLLAVFISSPDKIDSIEPWSAPVSQP
jgi:hypothetical protein